MTFSRGSEVFVKFSDPWDLVSAVGVGSHAGSIEKIAADGDSALIRLNELMAHKGRAVRALIAIPRHSGFSFQRPAQSLNCGFIAANSALSKRFDELEPRTLTSWFTAIGSVSIKEI